MAKDRGGTKAKPVSRSARAGLQFPVGRLARSAAGPSLTVPARLLTPPWGDCQPVPLQVPEEGQVRQPPGRRRARLPGRGAGVPLRGGARAVRQRGQGQQEEPHRPAPHPAGCAQRRGAQQVRLPAGCPVPPGLRGASSVPAGCLLQRKLLVHRWLQLRQPCAQAAAGRDHRGRRRAAVHPPGPAAQGQAGQEGGCRGRGGSLDQLTPAPGTLVLHTASSLPSEPGTQRAGSFLYSTDACLSTAASRRASDVPDRPPPKGGEPGLQVSSPFCT